MLPVHDCRLEISRLLGLIGAPPLHWNFPESETQSCDCDGEIIQSTREASIVVVEFLEAHVQHILAIDEAYQWLQISSSLHLGLGPRSQCVERVERASIAREFRKSSRRRENQDSPRACNEKAVETHLEPQKGLGKSILSLSNVRHHLAQSMVDQSDSISQLSYSMLEAVHASSSSSHLDDVYPSDPLEYPDVIDLIWIKGARQQLANDLSHSLNIYATSKGLLEIASNLEFRSLMQASMWNARNARQHLLGNLLLEKTNCTTSQLPVLANPKDPLLMSLMKYRDQVDALSGAIWASQQEESTESEHASKETERIEWWNHIRQLSEVCRSMESDIGQRFFAIPIDDHDDKEHDSDDIDGEHGSAIQEEYQHNYRNDNDNKKDDQTEKKVEDQQLPTRTLVFKGHGMKDERPTSKTVRPEKNRELTKHTLPPRDTVSERQMIQELQNRITAIRQAEDEDDDQDDVGTDAANNPVRSSRVPATPLFLGASGSLLSELRQTLPLPSSMDEEHVLEE